MEWEIEKNMVEGVTACFFCTDAASLLFAAANRSRAVRP